MIGCNVYLAFKVLCYKLYGDLQLFSISIYYWKNLSIDLVISLLISINWKDNNYNSIFVIVDRLTKIMLYKLVKVTIHSSGLTKVIIDIVVWYYGLFNSMISNCVAIFIFKFWFLLYYYFDIKWQLSSTFYSLTNS